MDTNSFVYFDGDVRTMVKHRWCEFEEEDLDEIDEDLDMLPDHIQKVYGCNRERAMQEYMDFILCPEAKGFVDEDEHQSQLQ